MDRRSFLIGSSSLLTTAYLTKADWFLKNKKSVVPFPTNTKNSTKLFLVDRGMEYEWRLDDPDFGFENLTYRQVLERYRGCYLPVEEPMSLSDYRDIYHEYGIMPKMLDQEADPMFYVDDWARSDANSAKAFHYLSGLDLFGDEYATGLRAGDLTFLENPNPASDYLGVISNDPISASLLQARLIELGQDTVVQIAG